MRTYSGFLLFEDVLDFCPNTSPDLFQFVQNVIRPRVLVVEEDCFTTIGKVISVNYEIEGLKELSTDTVINKARIDTLLTAGTYTVAVRNLFSCITPTGICRKCYAGTYIDQTAPAVGAYVRLEPEYSYQTDVLIGNGTKSVFTLTESPADYSKAIVIINGVIQTTGYTISDTTITLSVAPALNSNVVVKFYVISSQPFVGFLARTFTGSLLGLRALPTQTINIRPSLAQTLFTEEELTIVKNTLISKHKTITRNYVDYIDTIEDKLEKAIYLGMLYGLYSNVTT